ncbi:MAG: Imm8 family immunity protein [Gemmatales bacterium]
MDWEEFACNPSSTPWDDHLTFDLTIGPVGTQVREIFELTVATYIASCRLQGKGRHFKGIIVESFEPELVRKAILDHVESFESDTWHGLVDQLRKTMEWEFEGMQPISPHNEKRSGV